MFITAAPTLLPSTGPSSAPITAVPTPEPTITGAVASVSMSGPVTAAISVEDITTISEEIAEIYGVDPIDVETTVDYVTTGILDVTIPEGVSEDDALLEIQQSLGDVLGVHPKDIVVTIDDNGDVRYSVTEGSYEDAEAIQNIASDADFASKVTAALTEADSEVTVESVTSDADIEVVISSIVDTTDATGTVDPSTAVSDLSESYGLSESHTEGIILICFWIISS